MSAQPQNGTRSLAAGEYKQHKPAVYYCEEVHNIIVEAIRKGNNKTTAARLAGVRHDTLYDWLRMGRDNAEAFPHLHRLYEDVEKAIGEAQKEMLEIIRGTAVSQAPNTWQAAAWFLERSDPEHWGRRDAVKIQAEKPVFQINQILMPGVEVDTEVIEGEVIEGELVDGEGSDETNSARVRSESGQADADARRGGRSFLRRNGRLAIPSARESFGPGMVHESSSEEE